MCGVSDGVVTLLLILPILKKNQTSHGDLWNPKSSSGH